MPATSPAALLLQKLLLQGLMPVRAAAAAAAAAAMAPPAPVRAVTAAAAAAPVLILDAAPSADGSCKGGGMLLPGASSASARLLPAMVMAAAADAAGAETTLPSAVAGSAAMKVSAQLQYKLLSTWTGPGCTQEPAADALSHQEGLAALLAAMAGEGLQCPACCWVRLSSHARATACWTCSCTHAACA